MALKKQFNSYRNRLFIPIAAAIWIFVIALGIFHYKRNIAHNRELLVTTLDFINNRIIEAYNRGGYIQGVNALKNIDTYYINTTYDDLSVAVYDVATGDEIESAGAKLPPPNNIRMLADSYRIGTEKNDEDVAHLIPIFKRHPFYFRTRVTDDGRYLVQTVMPFTDRVKIKIDYSPMFLIVMGSLAVAVTIFVYIFISHLGRNIMSLRNFVQQAVNNENIAESASEFTDDELGDISRKIIELYKERTRAIENINREHRVALKATEEKNKLKRQLSDNINHELKTPIGIIKGYLDTILENPDMDEATKHHFLTKSADQVMRMTNLLNDISTITRLDEGGLSVPTEKIDFHDVVFTTANDIVESGSNGNMEFTFDIPFDCNIKGNFNLLGNVINNLAKNAATYSGGTEMSIKMIAQNRNFYTFSFYDNGKGLDPIHLPHLFERFYRVDTGRSRKKGGTGLGLPIVKSIIITMGGTISVRNRKGGGLEFLFTLPVWKEI